MSEFLEEYEDQVTTTFRIKLEDCPLDAELVIRGVPTEVDSETFQSIYDIMRKFTKTSKKTGKIVSSIKRTAKGKKKKKKKRGRSVRYTKDFVKEYWSKAEGKPTEERLKIINDMGSTISNLKSFSTIEAKFKTKFPDISPSKKDKISYLYDEEFAKEYVKRSKGLDKDERILLAQDLGSELTTYTALDSMEKKIQQRYPDIVGDKNE